MTKFLKVKVSFIKRKLEKHLALGQFGKMEMSSWKQSMGSREAVSEK